MFLNTHTTRILAALLVAFALVPAFAAPTSAHHDGSDHPCHPCEPTLEITGGRHPDAVPNPWGLDPLYVGWVTVDLILPDDPECRCFIEGWRHDWRTAVDNPLFGQSAGVDVTQVDSDTWLVHNLDADVYEVTFTVYVYCNEEMIPVTATWYQFN